jgi:uncharacterized PurR-regulated membrane protein YhhQ (DUF165 family)
VISTLWVHYSQPVSVACSPSDHLLLTDIVNEFYGTRGARFLTLMGMWMAVFTSWCQRLPDPHAEPNSFFTDAEFNKVFGVGGKLFVASIIAYLAGSS